MQHVAHDPDVRAVEGAEAAPQREGVELSADAIDSPQALIGDQVKAGVAVRMAVLYELLVGTPTLAVAA